MPKKEDAHALPLIVRLSPVPVIADIHFNASLALDAIDAGVARRADQPGQHRRAGQDRAGREGRQAAGIPMRIGANAGSLPKHLEELAREDTAEALVVEALEQVEILERLDFRDFKISVKASHVPTMIRAYRMLSDKVPYPLHLGVTEAGTPFAGSIKSAVGMGALLMDGIGDTMRVSLTADPVKEVEVAWEILKALGLRERGPVMIACPSCGRDNVGVESLAVVVEERLRDYPQAFEVAVMGCAVNGPGEAGDADFGIAGGRDVGFVYAHGRVLKKVSSDILIDELFHEIDRWIAAGMPRPKRLKLAKPAALAMAEASLIPLGRRRIRLSASTASARRGRYGLGMLRRALSDRLAFLRALALATGCAGAKSTASSIPESASLAPADALAFVTVTTDEGSEQWKNADEPLERVPGAKDGVSGSIGSALGEQGVDWSNDVGPAIGPELVVVATADQDPIVLVQPADEASSTRCLRRSTRPTSARDVDGWEALAESQAALDGYRAALGKGTLDDVDAFTKGFGALPSEALARAWVDTARLSKGLGRARGAASTKVDLGLDWLAAAVSAQDDGVPAHTRDADAGRRRHALRAEALRPRAGGCGRGGVLRRHAEDPRPCEGNVDLDKVSRDDREHHRRLAEGPHRRLSGEGALYVRPSAEQLPEVTLVLRPPDASKTWETLDGLARKLAEQARTTVTVRTENGTEVRRVTTDQVTISYARLEATRSSRRPETPGSGPSSADGPKLVDSDAYERAADAVDMGEKTRGFVYVDVDGALPLAERAGGSLPPDAKERSPPSTRSSSSRAATET